MLKDLDLLIVGAGPTGSVIAERAANLRGWSSVIVERRPHLAGNCFDSHHQSGVLIHRYGPHYFRTNNDELMRYLSAFTDWVPGNYIVKSQLGGNLYPFPINLTTLEKFFGRDRLTADSARALLESVREKIENPKNSEEFVVSRVGRELYEAFYLNYSIKQWERSPADLDPSVCGRIPVRFNRDDRYVEHKHQFTPAQGFTRLFERMISHPLIKVMLNADYLDLKNAATPRVATVFCGPLDQYFDFKLGRLPWRSLDFEYKVFDKKFVQPCVQINHPNDHAYTRTVEIKHVTRQIHPQTVVAYEYPRGAGDPYYPVPEPKYRSLFETYTEMAKQETRDKHVYFAGRLAEYKYMNTDEAIENALSVFDKISADATKRSGRGAA